MKEERRLDLPAGADAQTLRSHCRGVGQEGQVLVVVNAGSETFEDYAIPCPWARLQEIGAPAGARTPELRDGRASLPLAPFQVRVFAT